MPMRYVVLTVLIILMITPIYAAKYAGEPFSLGVGARGLALGGAVIAGPFDGAAGYWNPAGMNYLSRRTITAMHAETFGSLLNHDFVAYTHTPENSNSRFNAYGFYFYYLGGGGIKITDLDPNSGRPFVLREESHGDYLLAGSLSGKIKNKFDIGVTAKIIIRDIPSAGGYGLTADVGMLYKPYNFTRIGLVVTDITSGFIRYSNGTTESILPTVKPGLLFIHSIKDFTGRLVMSGDIKFEGIKYAAQYWAGEISLDTHFGFEGSYREMVFGRLGFDIGNFTGGVGIDLNRITIDLAYLHNPDLDETFRVSAAYNF